MNVRDRFTMNGTTYTVTRVTPKSIGYRSPAERGFEGIPYTTTPAALASLIAAGIIVKA